MQLRFGIGAIRHPNYFEDQLEWEKWRLAYAGGRPFVDKYLKKLSTREDDTDYLARKEVSYCPAFAKAAINDIKNAIFQRTVDIARTGGDPTYQKAINGLEGGVDLHGSSMNSYIGRYILPDMLTMRCIGVFVDMPPIKGNTIADAYGKRPYLYTYAVEDILSYSYDEDNMLQSILLRDNYYTYDEKFNLPDGKSERYRYVWREENQVYVQFYDEQGDESSDLIELKLNKIPFVNFEITESLMKDVADLQVALLNIDSSDIGYITKASYPMYVEQFDPRTEGAYFKTPNDFTDDAGEYTQTNTGRTHEIKAGSGQGRRVPIGTEMPTFIHPSAEPLMASMAKQEQLKREIRQLVNLTVANMGPQSADSKDKDLGSLETGLSFIGLVLENGERQIAEHWSAYLGNKQVATVKYPQNYTIKSEEQRQLEAEGDEKLLSKIPSDTFKREMAKKIANTKLGGKVSFDVLQKISKEISEAPALVSDPDQIHQDWEDGLVSTETASALRGYKPGEVEQATKDRAERIALTLEAQTAHNEQMGGQARGAKDFQSTQPKSVDEKQGKPQRGDGKKINKGPA